MRKSFLLIITVALFTLMAFACSGKLDINGLAGDISNESKGEIQKLKTKTLIRYNKLLDEDKLKELGARIAQEGDVVLESSWWRKIIDGGQASFSDKNVALAGEWLRLEGDKLKDHIANPEKPSADELRGQLGEYIRNNRRYFPEIGPIDIDKEASAIAKEWLDKDRYQEVMMTVCSSDGIKEAVAAAKNSEKEAELVADIASLIVPVLPVATLTFFIATELLDNKCGWDEE